MWLNNVPGGCLLPSQFFVYSNIHSYPNSFWKGCLIEGVFVWQDLESEKIKNHLTILAKRFNKAISMIQPPTHDRPSRQSQPFSELEVIVEKEHKKLLARKVLIERRKEEQERQMLEMVGGKSFPCHPMWFQCFLFR
jgi:hypothetical protein